MLRSHHDRAEPPPATGDEGSNAGPLPDFRGVLVWETDEWAIRFALLNPAAAPMLAGVGGDLPLDAEFLRKHVHHDDWRTVLETLYRAAAEGGAQNCQHRMCRGDGSSFWAHTTVERGPRSNGAIVLSGVTVDITALMHDVAATRKAEEDSRLLVQNLREYAVFRLTPDGHVATWNTGGQLLNGYTAEEILGSHVSRFFTEEEVLKGTPTRLLETAVLTRQADYEGWLVRKGGSRFWATLTLDAVTDQEGRLCGFSHLSSDLTQRRQLEEALRQSEAHFRLLVESVQDHALLIVSPTGEIQTWNRGAQRLEGYRAHEVIGSPMSRFFPAEEIENGSLAKLLRDAELTGSASYEGWLTRKNGTRFWAAMTLSAIEDEDGRLRGFSQVARDLTERKQSEDWLRDSEERLRLLLDSLQDYAVYMISPEGRVASWSPGAARISGYEEDEVLGSSVARFFPQDEVESGSPSQLLARGTSEGRAEYEGWMVSRSGTRFWATLILSAVRDRKGNLHGFSAVARDLTDRMRAERAQAFMAEVGTVLAGSLDFRRTSEAVCALATRELAEWCSLAIRTDDSIEPVAIAHVDKEKERGLRRVSRPVPYEPRVGHGVSSVLQTGQSELVAEVPDSARLAETLAIPDAKILRELGTRSYMCVPLTARGKTFGVIVLGAPPDRRYTPSDLRVADELAHRAALAVDNARLFEEAQHAIRAREDVLAVVSHDLRNPLSTIEMGATVLAQVGAEGTEEPTATSRTIDRIKRASERMTHLIRDLLDFSSMDGGRLALELAQHEAGALVAEAVETAQPIASEKGVRLVKEVTHDAHVSVQCDRERILQVFSNLIGNAVRFTDEGGSITVRSRVERDRVVFSVRDTGPGIAADDVPRIFDRYWQAERRARGGTGLGLAIAKGIVESHGGAIWVESKLGEGATFYLALPLEAGSL